MKDMTDTIEDMMRDAKRYRYLKETQMKTCRDWGSEEDDMDIVGVIDHIFVCTGYGEAIAPSPEEFDAYVDSAMLLFPKPPTYA